MRTTHIGASTSDNVTFESSLYCMIANIGKGQYTDIEIDARSEKDMNVELLKFGSVFSRFDRFHEINDVELLGMQGEYTYHRRLHNAPMRYYFENYRKAPKAPELANLKMKRFPMDSHKTSYMGELLNGWHPPTSDQPWLALGMPEVGALAESTNKINIYGSIMMETELKVHFYTDVPFAITPGGEEVIQLEDLTYNFNTHTLSTLSCLRK
nr:conserved hypothetical protein [Hymenolepis microstoma]